MSKPSTAIAAVIERSTRPARQTEKIIFARGIKGVTFHFRVTRPAVPGSKYDYTNCQVFSSSSRSEFRNPQAELQALFELTSARFQPKGEVRRAADGAMITHGGHSYYLWATITVDAE